MTETTRESLWDAYDATLVELGEANDDVVVVDADYLRPSRQTPFRSRFPSRFFDVAVEDPTTILTSTRLALEGKSVFASAFAVLAAGRGYADVRESLCRPNADVKIVANPQGALPNGDGTTETMVEDLGLMRGLPGMTVACPADAPSARAMLRAMSALDGPAYVRMTHETLPVVTDGTFEIGRANVLTSGGDLTIIAVGPLVARALEVAEELERVGLYARVLDLASVKPFDEKAVLRAARETGAILTLEEHSVLTGIGALVASATSEEYPVPVRRMGTPDVFPTGSTPETRRDRVGLSRERCLEEAYELLRVRGKVQ